LPVSVSPGLVALIASIPTIWAIKGLVITIARRMVPARLKPYLAAAFGCALAMLFTIPPHLGFMLILVAFPLVIWALLSVVVVLRKPDQLKQRGIILGFWLTMILTVLGMNWHYAVDARRAGDEFARVIEQYKIRHGVYPPDMKSAGLVRQRNSGMLGYIMYEGKPSLIYAATSTMFDTYDYDLEHHVWVYQLNRARQVGCFERSDALLLCLRFSHHGSCAVKRAEHRKRTRGKGPHV
jgi:hypothetical protein